MDHHRALPPRLPPVRDLIPSQPEQFQCSHCGQVACVSGDRGSTRTHASANPNDYYASPNAASREPPRDTWSQYRPEYPLRVFEGNYDYPTSSHPPAYHEPTTHHATYERHPTDYAYGGPSPSQEPTLAYHHHHYQRRSSSASDLPTTMWASKPMQMLPGFSPSVAGHQRRRYIGAVEVDGRWFHRYEGDFFLPMDVDGQDVNPLWGLTKANTPRKRQATACERCRSKKIKCEAQADGCLQCRRASVACQTGDVFCLAESSPYMSPAPQMSSGVD